MRIIAGDNYLEEIKKLIIEYVQFLDRDLGFQGLDTELNHLADKYTNENGRILIALNDEDKAVGCVAYYRHNDKRCEMKRLFVKPEFRKLKIGQKLIEEIIKLAKENGYKEMVLDTIKPLENAISLYKKYGFYEIEPYYNNPMEDVIYMKLDL